MTLKPVQAQQHWVSTLPPEYRAEVARMMADGSLDDTLRRVARRVKLRRQAAKVLTSRFFHIISPVMTTLATQARAEAHRRVRTLTVKQPAAGPAA